jgi:hypothetical protein
MGKLNLFSRSAIARLPFLELPSLSRVGKMDTGEDGGRNFHGRNFTGPRSRLVKLQLPHLGLSWLCDSDLGLLLLRTHCVSLPPRPLTGNFLLAKFPTPAVWAVGLQYDVGQTTRTKQKSPNYEDRVERLISVFHWKGTRLGHALQNLGVSALEGQTDNAHQYAWLDVRTGFHSYLTKTLAAIREVLFDYRALGDSILSWAATRITSFLGNHPGKRKGRDDAVREMPLTAECFKYDPGDSLPMTPVLTTKQLRRRHAGKLCA